MGCRSMCHAVIDMTCMYLYSDWSTSMPWSCQSVNASLQHCSREADQLRSNQTRDGITKSEAGRAGTFLGKGGNRVEISDITGISDRGIFLHRGARQQPSLLSDMHPLCAIKPGSHRGDAVLTR